MVIYGNNLHEKLFGIAISKDYLKYNTPFCDFVDDPDFEVDIELAVNFNKSINGNTEAARSFTETLVLSSGSIDWSTLNFYNDKMLNTPSVFAGLMDEFRGRFTAPENYDDSFQDKLNNAVKDCLNSPCNLFAATSDSIGRQAQAASTKTDKNTFGVGALANSFTNIMNGLDQAVFNKIPSIFQTAFTDITQLGSKAVTNTQAILAGKKNLDELVSLAQNGTSMRDTSKTYRYTPDIKTYFDSAAAGSAILTQIKDQTGGCFDKFQNAYRYNPYEDNLSVPMTVQTQQYNGIQYETDAGGVYDNPLTRTTQIAKTNTRYRPPTILKPGDTFLSETVSLAPRALAASNGTNNGYSIFAGFIDANNKTFWVDDITAERGGIGSNLKYVGRGDAEEVLTYCPSFLFFPNNKEHLPASKLSDALNKTIQLSEQKLSAIVNKYNVGYTHDLTPKGFETIQTGKIFNDGVAVSREAWRKLTGTIIDSAVESSSPPDGGFMFRIRNNKAFVAVRKPGSGPTGWKLYKIIDSTYDDSASGIINFTPAAYKDFFGQLGGRPLLFSKNSLFARSSFQREFDEAGWKVNTHKPGNDGDIEIKICSGDISQIKEQLLVGDSRAPSAGRSYPTGPARVTEFSRVTPLAIANRGREFLEEGA